MTQLNELTFPIIHTIQYNGFIDLYQADIPSHSDLK